MLLSAIDSSLSSPDLIAAGSGARDQLGPGEISYEMLFFDVGEQLEEMYRIELLDTCLRAPVPDWLARLKSPGHMAPYDLKLDSKVGVNAKITR